MRTFVLKRKRERAYYASPPQTPSIVMSIKTIAIASPSLVAGIIPVPDSMKSMKSMKNCTIAGKGNRREGNAGKPSEMDDRERKTVD